MSGEEREKTRKDNCIQAWTTVRETGSVRAAAIKLGVPYRTLDERCKRAIDVYGLQDVRPGNNRSLPATPVPESALVPDVTSDQLADIILLKAKRPGGVDIDSLQTNGSFGQILEALDLLRGRGIDLQRIGNRYELNTTPQPAWSKEEGEKLEIYSDKNNCFTFGAVSDNHAASKYERLDVFEDLYSRFANRGITDVFHAGNWIDGEARFNRQDIVAFGLEGQARYLAKTYPRRPGLTTHAIWGDDHEGWYTREGIDVGRYVEDVMHSEGRDDWRNIGFMESHVKLVNANTGATAILAVVHPGGGSAYAISYKPQKIIESMEGGQKPAVAIFGHYHKQEILNIRNVWAVQPGAGQDQSVFMRKKSLEAHVGGCRIELEQDPETGAIVECNGMRRYFTKAYYTAEGRANNLWSKHGPITPAPRSAGGV